MCVSGSKELKCVCFWFQGAEMCVFLVLRSLNVCVSGSKELKCVSGSKELKCVYFWF